MLQRQDRLHNTYRCPLVPMQGQLVHSLQRQQVVAAAMALRQALGWTLQLVVPAAAATLPQLPAAQASCIPRAYAAAMAGRGVVCWVGGLATQGGSQMSLAAGAAR